MKARQRWRAFSFAIKQGINPQQSEHLGVRARYHSKANLPAVPTMYEALSDKQWDELAAVQLLDERRAIHRSVGRHFRDGNGIPFTTFTKALSRRHPELAAACQENAKRMDALYANWRSSNKNFQRLGAASLSLGLLFSAIALDAVFNIEFTSPFRWWFGQLGVAVAWLGFPIAAYLHFAERGKGRSAFAQAWEINEGYFRERGLFYNDDGTIARRD